MKSNGFSKNTLLLAAAILATGNLSARETVTPDTVPEAGNLDVKWADGTDCASAEAIQVHRYNPDFIVLRQSLCLNFEGPFMFLIFGDKEALLLDTGAVGNATAFPIRRTVEGLLTERLQEKGIERKDYRLVVAHTHSHGDHVAGDRQFAGQENTILVGLRPRDVAQHFGITSWPMAISSYDLGNRVLDVVPIPGHEDSSIAVYDRQTAVLLTGDSLYPGRHYVDNYDWSTDRESMMRLHAFMADKPISYVLGTHIEMWDNTVTGKLDEIPFGESVHANAQHQEAVLELGRSDLDEMAEYFRVTPQAPGGKRFRGARFIVHPL